jgi:transketolase
MIDQLNQWKELAAQLRVDSIRATTAAGSGHPTSAMSCADMMAVLLTKYLRFDWDRPQNRANDRLIFSKGHACPALYSMYKAAGVVSDDELLSLRKLGSRLEGHPNPRVLPMVDVATGSLGQGLPMAVGMALAGRLDKLAYHVWVVLGDSEMAEGSVWEAFDKAAYYQLNKIVAIVDVNRLGQRGETELGWNTAAYANRARAFGWNPIELDGHDLEAIDRAFADAVATSDRPTCLVARTIKGAGVSFVANQDGWHGKALNEEQARTPIAELGGERKITVRGPLPEASEPGTLSRAQSPRLPTYSVGSQEATRKAFGEALAAVGASSPEVVCLDGEVGNSTHTDLFGKAYPERFFQMFIAEQQMVGAAVGLATCRKKPFAATFAAFLTRAFDFIRMAAVSGVAVRLCGSHAGVSIGEDGPSQMGLEDLAMMRAVYGSTVLYPCDANQTADLVARMVDLAEISYLRTTRAKTPVIYPPGMEFPIGGSHVLRQSDRDEATIVAAGITVHEALTAFERLNDDGITVRVIDAYSVKPIDRETLHRAAQETGKLVVVEDHWIEGGLGDAVLEAFAGAEEPLPRVAKLAVRAMPGSGTPEELLHVAGTDADAIVQAVHEMINVASAHA